MGRRATALFGAAIALVAVVLGAVVAAWTVSAHSGVVVASEDCHSWSVSVSVIHVTSDRHVDIVTTIPGSTGVTDGHYVAPVLTQIWSASGKSPATGTVTLNIYVDTALEFSASASISPPTGCAPPPTPTPSPTTTPTSPPTPTPTLRAGPPVPSTGAGS